MPAYHTILEIEDTATGKTLLGFCADGTPADLVLLAADAAGIPKATARIKRSQSLPGRMAPGQFRFISGNFDEVIK